MMGIIYPRGPDSRNDELITPLIIEDNYDMRDIYFFFL